MNQCERFSATLEAFEQLRGKLGVGSQTIAFKPGTVEVPDSVVSCLAEEGKKE